MFVDGTVSDTTVFEPDKVEPRGDHVVHGREYGKCKRVD